MLRPAADAPSTSTTECFDPPGAEALCYEAHGIETKQTMNQESFNLHIIISFSAYIYIYIYIHIHMNRLR